MTKGPSVVEEEATHEDFSQQDIAKAVVSILPEMKAFEGEVFLVKTFYMLKFFVR